MGRNVDRTNAEDRVWYLPDIDENRKDPDPFMVLIGPVDGATMRKCRSSMKAHSGALDQEAIVDTLLDREERLRLRVVADHVFDVSGYSVKDTKTGKISAPRNGQELVDVIMDDGTPESEAAILGDVYTAIVSFSALGEDVKKKQSAQSGSSTQTMTGEKAGDAAVAGVQTSQTKITSDQPVIVTVVPTHEASAASGSRG